MIKKMFPEYYNVDLCIHYKLGLLYQRDGKIVNDFSLEKILIVKYGTW